MTMNLLRKGADKLTAHADSFVRSEAGSVSPLVIIFFMMMIVTGGIAIDLMRFETRRVAVQSTLDRAALAAANLDQTLSPVAVVEDYFAKAGIEDDLEDVNVVHTINSRTVTARATVRSPNLFMDLIDIPYLEAVNTSEAEQRITDVEVFLVLDVSGSMGGTKLTNLKSAAREFVDTVKLNDSFNKISIGIVPYNAQVNLGNLLRSKYNATHQHGVTNANCFELPASVFSSLALSRTEEFPMMAYADVVNGTTTNTAGYVAPAAFSNSAATRWCNATTDNPVTMPSKNGTDVKNAITRLSANGNTSILLGMRWATALIDPAARSIYNEMISSSDMNSNMSGRPYDHDDPESMKVIVLMTDGQHVAHNRVNDAYKTGTSPIYYNSSDQRFSIYHDRANTNNDYWVPHANSGNGEWRSQPWGYSNSNQLQPLDWSEVWSRVPVTWVAYQLYARALGSSSSTRTTAYNTWLGNFRSLYQSETSMNNLLWANCTAARNAGIIVYGIAFEAPLAGQTAIRNCTSLPQSTYYFDAQGIQIAQVFRMIAANLSQLRLTQ